MATPGDQPPEPLNWGAWFIHQVVHPMTVFLPPVILLLLMGYFVVVALDGGLGPGLRSIAAILLPLSLVTFAHVFKRPWLSRLGAVPPLASFAGSLAIGLAIMFAIRLYARAAPAPIAELVLSSSFALLVFSHATLRENAVSAYSYGMICGMLLYIIVLGFPSLR